MFDAMNICTATMPAFQLPDCLKLASLGGYQGIELRVHDKYHVTLNQLYHHGKQIRKDIESHNLELSVLNTYYGIIDTCAIDTLIRTCRRIGVDYFRVVLPIAGQAAVSSQAYEGAIIPSYSYNGTPLDTLLKVKESLYSLERKAKKAGITALLEIHWGTIMSSFSSTHFLIHDLDPDAVAITFDPANMIIEGKEDWEYGINLLKKHMINLHIKNVSWEKYDGEWKWRWDKLAQGLVNWPELTNLLNQANYNGMTAMEDFCVPSTFDSALEHISNLRKETIRLNKQSTIQEAA